jgi:hypothetical protein
VDKTITISGRSVTFRKTGGTALRYKRQFGRELFAEIGKMVDLYADFQKIEQFITDKSAKTSAMAKLVASMETDFLYDILYIMAQQADPSITDQIEWLDSFERFDVWSVFGQVRDLIMDEQAVDPKNA